MTRSHNAVSVNCCHPSLKQNHKTQSNLKKNAKIQVQFYSWFSQTGSILAMFQSYFFYFYFRSCLVLKRYCSYTVNAVFITSSMTIFVVFLSHCAALTDPVDKWYKKAYHMCYMLYIISLWFVLTWGKFFVSFEKHLCLLVLCNAYNVLNMRLHKVSQIRYKTVYLTKVVKTLIF